MYLCIYVMYLYFHHNQNKLYLTNTKPCKRTLPTIHITHIVGALSHPYTHVASQTNVQSQENPRNH
jgi:hypothetical protein